MKKYFSFFVALVITLGANAQNQARFIPADAFIVSEYNLKSLYEKGNLEEIKKLEMFQKWEEEAAKELKEKYNDAKVIWNNPAATGIDLNSHAYYYVYIKDDQPYAGFILPVKNMAAMEDLLLNKLDLDKGKKVQKAGKMKMLDFGSDGVALWGSDVLVFVDLPGDPENSYPGYDESASEKETAKAWEVWEAKRAAWNKKQAAVIAGYVASGSILQQQHFRDLHAKNYDIGLYLHSTRNINETVIPLYLTMLGLPDLSNSALFDEHYTCSGINFEKGAINATTQSFYSPRLAQYIEPIYSTRFNPSLLRYINSKEAVAFATVSISMPAVKKVLKEKADSLTRLAEIEFAQALYSNEIRKDEKILEYTQKINDLYNERAALYGDKGYYQYYNSNGEYAAPADSVAVAVEPAEVDTAVVYDDNSYEVDYEAFDRINREIEALQKLEKARRNELGIVLMKKDGFDPSWVWDLTGGDMLYSLDELYPEIKTYEYPAIDPETYETVMETRTDTVPYPHYTVVLSIGDKTKMEKFLTILTKQGYLKNKGTFYTMVNPADPKHEHFVYISNNNLVLTNNSKLAVLNRDGFQDGRSYDPILAGRCQDNSMLFRFNTDNLMASLKKTEKSKRDLMTFSIIEKYMGSLESDGGKMIQGQHHGNATLEFGSVQENSLLQLFRFSNEFFLLYQR